MFDFKNLFHCQDVNFQFCLLVLIILIKVASEQPFQFLRICSHLWYARKLSKFYRNVFKILVNTASKHLKSSEALRVLMHGLLASKRAFCANFLFLYLFYMVREAR